MSEESTATASTDQMADQPTRVKWHGILGVEGQTTGDGRLIEPGALRWENLPLPLRYVAEDMGAHDGAVTVGWIRTIDRDDDGNILGTGDIDLGSEAGREAARHVREGLTRGVSMDLDDITFEIRVAKGLMDGADDTIDVEGVDDAATHAVVHSQGPDDELFVTLDGRMRAATLVAIPAFIGAEIELDEGSESTGIPADEIAASIAASAAPMRPPAEWFRDPQLQGPTGLRVTGDGYVFGHLALWGTCHIGIDGVCTQPPNSAHGYAYFTTGAVLTAEGTEVPVGVITMDTRHAGPELSASRTSAHYEHTGHQVADVAVGEDQHGIWVAGALRPSATDAQIRALRSSPLSGDWRRIGGNLELVAALAVNVPGFPVPRPQGLVAGGHQQSLVASGLVPPATVIHPDDPEAFLTRDDLRFLKRLAAQQRADAEDEAKREAAALERRVRASALRMRVMAAAKGA